MSSKPGKGGVSQASWYWVWTIAGALAYELFMLTAGHRGGALSHVVWWAAGEQWTWRWVAVLSPICGLLTWCLPHFILQWGTGLHLLGFVAAWALVLGAGTLAN